MILSPLLRAKVSRPMFITVQCSGPSYPGSMWPGLVMSMPCSAIPIVFEIGGDPVRSGLVASFNQPGGNVTGITSMNLELAGKLLGLLHEVLPRAARFAVLVNPNNSTIAEATITDARAAATSLGLQIEVLTARTNDEIDMVFAS